MRQVGLFQLKSRRIATVSILFGSLFPFHGCTASMSISVLDRCEAQAEQADDPKVLRKIFERESSGSTMSREMVESAVKFLASDPDAKLMEWILCMGDAGALCYMDTSKVEGAAFMDEVFLENAVARGWAEPTLNDCFFEKTGAIVANPFKD